MVRVEADLYLDGTLNKVSNISRVLYTLSDTEGSTSIRVVFFFLERESVSLELYEALLNHYTVKHQQGCVKTHTETQGASYVWKRAVTECRPIK